MPEPRSIDDLARAVRDLEREVSGRRDLVAHDLREPTDKRGKSFGERADLNPVRHLAICITELESVRFRLREAGRLERAAQERA